MQETHSKKHSNDFGDEINFVELFNVLWDGKWIIISLTGFISIVGVIYSLSLPNIYSSKALLASVNSSSGISGTLRGYAGFAGLAGISVPTAIDEGNSAKAIEKINSLSFFENNILPNIFLPDLMALDSWDSDTNSMTYDESIYNNATNTWLKIPSVQESFGEFGSHLSLFEDKKTGFISIAVKHQSPFIAKEWADLVVDEVNAFYRQKEKLESEKAVSYLNQQISITSLAEIKQVLAQLLQEETKKLTLIEANESFVFDYIDPPAVMEKKSEPRRAYICMIIAIIGGILSISIVLIRHFIFNKKNLIN